MHSDHSPSNIGTIIADRYVKCQAKMKEIEKLIQIEEK